MLDSIVKWAQIVESLATVGVLAVAVKALAQIKVAKDSTNSQTRRDALRLSGRQIDKFGEDIITLAQKMDITIEKNDIKILKNARLVDGALKSKLGKKETATEFKKLLIIVDDLQRLMNLLEAFATYFTSGLANEEVAFDVCGKAYCRMIDDYRLPLDLLEDEGFAKSTLDLYKKWSSRLNEQKLKQTKAKIDIELQKLDSSIIETVGKI